MLLAGPSQSFHTSSYISSNKVDIVDSDKSSLDSSSRESSRDATSSAASIITISSTSSAASSSNSRFSFVKQMVNRGTELLKQTVHNSLLAKLTPSASKEYAKKQTTILASEHLALTPSSVSSSSSSNSDSQPQVQPRSWSEHSSADSLQTEMCHFKPIRTMPKTPVRAENEVIKIRSIRPESSRSSICFTPSPSPFKPNDPTTPRRSAFSVVSFISHSVGDSPTSSSISPIAEEPTTDVVVKLKPPPKPKGRGRGGNRKRKSSVSPQKLTVEDDIPPKATPSKSRKVVVAKIKQPTPPKPVTTSNRRTKQPTETVSKPYALRRLATTTAPEEVKVVKVVATSVAVVQNVRRSTRKKA